MEDEHSAGVGGLDAILEREGIAQGYEGEKSGLARRPGATKHSPKRRNRFNLGIFAIGRPETRPPARPDVPATTTRRRPWTDHGGL